MRSVGTTTLGFRDAIVVALSQGLVRRRAFRRRDTHWTPPAASLDPSGYTPDVVVAKTYAEIARPTDGSDGKGSADTGPQSFAQGLARKGSDDAGDVSRLTWIASDEATVMWRVKRRQWVARDRDSNGCLCHGLGFAH